MIWSDHSTKRHRKLVASLGIAIVLALVMPWAVLAHGPDPILGGGLFAQGQDLRFRWRAGSEPIAVIRTAITAAASDANTTRNSRSATFTYDAAGPNPIGYGPGATCGVNGLACFTRTAPTGFTMWLREQGHVFDWGTLRWCQVYASPPNGCYDAETIALDEFGHVEVLNHHVNYNDEHDYLDAVVQTFSRVKPQAVPAARSPRRRNPADRSRFASKRDRSGTASSNRGRRALPRVPCRDRHGDGRKAASRLYIGIP